VVRLKFPTYANAFLDAAFKGIISEIGAFHRIILRLPFLDTTLVKPSASSSVLELVPTLMIDDLDKSCAKAEPNFDK
jgi:hypothetical protein